MCDNHRQADALEGQSDAPNLIDEDRIKQFNRLIYWNDPKVTGTVFASINLFFWLTIWRNYSILFLASSVLFYTVCTSAICHVLAWGCDRLGIRKTLSAWTAKTAGYAKLEMVDDLEAATAPVRVEVNPVVTNAIQGGLNLFLNTIHQAIWMRDLKLTMLAIITTYVVAQISLVMDAFTMVYFGSVSLFTVPKLIQLALSVDQVLEKWILVQSHATRAWTVINEKVISKIPSSIGSPGSPAFTPSPRAGTDIRQRRGGSTAPLSPTRSMLHAA